MRKVERSELLPLGEYETIRPHFRNRVIELKKARRVALGEHMSLVFENHDTVLLQIQEMLRTERISDERAIAHELETYNELVPRDCELSATLFIEYDDQQERRQMLHRFASLREQVYLRAGDQRVRATFSTHFGEEMDLLPAVNYLHFELGREIAARVREDAAVHLALEVSHPDYEVSVPIPDATRRALIDDLS